MPRFSVLVTRDTTQHCYIEVEAEDENEAEDKAVEIANDDESSVTWYDDDGESAAYIAAPGGCAEELEDESNG